MHLEFIFSLRGTQALISSSPFIQLYIQSAIVHCHLGETLTSVNSPVQGKHVIFTQETTAANLLPTIRPQAFPQT